MNNTLPTSTITFLFTDIDGSTQLWERYPEAMKLTLARHDRLLREAIESYSGRVVKTTGDGCHAVFVTAADALAAAITAQRKLRVANDELLELQDGPTGRAGVTPPSQPVIIRVRMGLHTGEAELRDGDYYGSAVNRAARIMSIGHGGQVLLSAVTASLVVDTLPKNVSLTDLGEHRLRDLSRPERIYQLVAERLPADFPPLRSLNAYPGNLPVQLTSFIGRERELAEVKRLLATTRLLTLTGPGGTGKTRLSLQVAADLQSTFAHGAWLVELAPLSDPALIPGAVAGLFGLSPQPGTTLMGAVRDYLRGKHMLLILDNCEHLVEACARLASDLLAVASRLTILASSREGLGVVGETTFHVPTLGLPDTADTTASAVCRHDAADLFLQRARAVQPAFAVTDENAAAIAQIVRRLDGIPLAIELAAARVRLLAPGQIAARLDDRFRLLTGGSRTALPRQQTLRALIDWSYALLSPEEATLFRSLGVFIGGWTLEAAEDVCGAAGIDVLDTLSGLVNKSLVVVEAVEIVPVFGALVADIPSSGFPTVTRYRYLETIRQYARDKLFESGEGEVARDRHMDFYDRVLLTPLGSFKMMEGALGLLAKTSDAGMADWMRILEPDIENLRAAVRWALERDAERALLMATLLAFAQSSARVGDDTPALHEALAAVDALPAVTDEAVARRLQLRIVGNLALGHHAIGMGESSAALSYYGEAARLARRSANRGLLARALVQRSLAASFLNDDAIFENGEEAVALFRELGEPMGAAQALGQMSLAYLRRGDLARATSLAREAIAMMKASNDPLAPALSHLMTPALAYALGDVATAEALYRDGIAEFRRLHSQAFVFVLKSDLGHMLRREGRHLEALELYREAIRMWQDWGRRASVANILENYAFIARTAGQPERAIRLLGAAEAIRDEIHVDMTPWEREEYEREVATLRESLSPETLVVAWAAGRALTLDEAVDYAVAM